MFKSDPFGLWTALNHVLSSTGYNNTSSWMYRTHKRAMIVINMHPTSPLSSSSSSTGQDINTVDHHAIIIEDMQWIFRLWWWDSICSSKCDTFYRDEINSNILIIHVRAHKGEKPLECVFWWLYFTLFLKEYCYSGQYKNTEGRQYSIASYNYAKYLYFE